ncbi:MAG: DUF448 domain-containing protein, partial [Acetobacteraceae bacterium]
MRTGRWATADAGTAGPRRPARTPSLRRCLLTRNIAPKGTMVRFVAGRGGMLVPDLEARLPGRGIWLSAEGDVIETARASGRLGRTVARVTGGPVAIPDDLLLRLQEGLVRR